MIETTLYEERLGIERLWRVRDVRLALERSDVEVGVEFAGETLVCPACGRVSGLRTTSAGVASSGHDAVPDDWLQVARFAAAARQCRLSWDQLAGIQERAVRRGCRGARWPRRRRSAGRDVVPTQVRVRDRSSTT